MIIQEVLLSLLDQTRFLFILLPYFGLFLPFLILYLRFLFDNKIHTKEQLNKIIGDANIPVVGEIPFNPDQNDLKVSLKVHQEVLLQRV